MPTFFTVYVQDLSENMDSFWVAFDIDENDRVRFRPRYEGLLCPRCQSYDPYAILERGLDPDIKVTHKRGAFSTNDNFLVVDRQARSTLESLAGAELVFHELPGDPRYAVVLPRQPFPIQLAGTAMECKSPCPSCQRQLFVRWHPDRLTLPEGWAFGALIVPAHRSLWNRWIGEEAAVKALKATRSKAWLFDPLVPLPRKVTPSKPGVSVLAGPKKASGGPGVAFSPDGRWLANAGGRGDQRQEVVLWDAHTGALLWNIKERGSAFTNTVFAPDGKTLVVGGFSGQLVHLEAATGKILSRRKMPGGQDFHTLAASPDGQTLAYTTLLGSKAFLLDFQTADVRKQFDSENANALPALAFSPDGYWLACGGWHKLDIWPLTDNGARISLRDQSPGSVSALAYSPDGRLLASVGNSGSTKEKKNGDLLIWDTTTWMCQHRLPCHRRNAHAVAFAPDGSLLATGGDEKTVILWEVQTAKKLATLKDHIASDMGFLGLAFAPLGRVLACADAGGVGEAGQVTLYNLDRLL